MKATNILQICALFTSLLFINCSVDDAGGTDDGINVLPCDSAPQNLLALSTPFDGSANAAIDYHSFSINNLSGSQPTLEGSLQTTSNLTYQLPTNTSFYNSAENLHGVLVSRGGKYFAFDTDSGQAQEFTVSTDVSAPILLAGTTYIMEVANSGYANAGVGNHFGIKLFDGQTGTVGSTFSLDPMTTAFDNNSFFNVESMSAATDGGTKLYYLSGTNLVTINTATHTASHIDLYPSFSTNDYVRFFGLEFSQTLGLIAIMDQPDLGIQKLVNIDASTGNYSPLLTLPTDINSEFYSTAFRECDQTYYLTSLKNPSNSVETNYFEFNLANSTVANTQVMADYVFGIELLP